MNPFRTAWSLLHVLVLAIVCRFAPLACAQDLLVANNSALDASILRYTASGTLLGDFAISGFGNSPVGMAFDSSRNVYVAIHGAGSSIHRYSSTGTDLGVFASAGLSGPMGVAFDSTGRLVVCNYFDNSISAYSPSGALLLHVVTGMVNPNAIAIDRNDNIYVSTSNQGTNSGVFRFQPDGSHQTLFATGSDLDARGIAFDAAGNLYVANPFDNSVRRFAPNGTPLGVFASTGLNLPFALAFNASGDLFVSNQIGGAIRRFSPNGTDLGNFAVVGPDPANPVGLAFFPVPEPGSLPLLILGAAAMARPLLRKRN